MCLSNISIALRSSDSDSFAIGQFMTLQRMSSSKNAPLFERMIYSYWQDLNDNEREELVSKIQTAYYQKYNVLLREKLLSV